MGITVDLIRNGDELMRAGCFKQAQKAYRDAWSPSRDELTAKQRVWLMLAIAHSSIRAGDFSEAFDVCAAAQNHFARPTGNVAGNPLFHLLAGLAAHELGEPEIAEDSLARALICGGPGIFTDEKPSHLERLRTILRPPAELGTWEGYEGCSRAQLNSVLDFVDGDSGYLAALLERRLGKPLPYRAPLQLDEFEGACSEPTERPTPWIEGRIHSILRRSDGKCVVEFYADIDGLPEGATTARIDYRIVDETFSDVDARELVVHVYFVRFVDHHYRGKISAFDIGRLGDTRRVTITYPDRA